MKELVFDEWNLKKKRTHFEGHSPYFSVGDIWWAQHCLVLPLTSKNRKGDYYYSFEDSKNNFQCALLTQVRYLDGKRLKYQQAVVAEGKLKSLKEAFICLLNK